MGDTAYHRVARAAAPAGERARRRTARAGGTMMEQDVAARAARERARRRIRGRQRALGPQGMLT